MAFRDVRPEVLDMAPVIYAKVSCIARDMHIARSGDNYRSPVPRQALTIN